MARRVTLWIAWGVGVAFQAAALGALLALALILLSSWTGGVRVFRYEAF